MSKVLYPNSICWGIYEDRGWYEGTIKEYNVRRLQRIVLLEHLHWDDVERLIGDGYQATAYGRGWGSLGTTYVISDAEAEILMNADKAIVEAQEREAKEREEARQKRIEDALAEAKRTGKAVQISCYTTACDGSECECSTDIIYVMANPNGEITRERVHCF